jgi:hypothetical protein
MHCLLTGFSVPAGVFTYARIEHKSAVVRCLRRSRTQYLHDPHDLEQGNHGRSYRSADCRVRVRVYSTVSCS